MAHQLTIGTVTDTTVDMILTLDDTFASDTTATFTAYVSGGQPVSDNATIPAGSAPGDTIEKTLTGLTPSTTYTAAANIAGFVPTIPGGTFTTEPIGYNNPKVATQDQWQDLASRVKAKADSSDVPTITMTSTDPGEGSPLAANHYVAVYGTMGSLLDMFYPVGSYYETSDTTFNPNTAWGGTWLEDSAGYTTVAYASGDTDFGTVGGTGGEKTHTLTVTEIPSHRHAPGSTTHPRFCVGTGANYHTTASGTGSGVENEVQYTDYTGGGGAHNNLSPYIVVKRWHRTA